MKMAIRLLSGIILILALATFVHAQTWEHNDSGVSYLNDDITCYAISPNGDIYAGGWHGAVYKSTDNGDSWDTLTTDLALAASKNDRYSYWITALAVNSAGDVFAGTSYYTGIYRSTDDGESWTRINNGLTEAVWAVAINSSDDIFVGTWGQGVCISTDSGSSWSESGLSTDICVISLAIDTSEYIYAGGQNSANCDGGIYRSTDDGDNWNSFNSGLSDSTVNAFAVNSSGYIYAATDDGIFVSSGYSWSQTGLDDIIVNSLAITNTDFIMAGTDDSNGVYFSTNGYTWAAMNSGLPTYGVYAVVLNDDGDAFAGLQMASGIGLYRLTRECGDVNNDYAVNLFDINYLQDSLYNGGPPPYPLYYANVNGDATINIFDITYLIAYLYLEGPAPDCAEVP